MACFYAIVDLAIWNSGSLFTYYLIQYIALVFTLLLLSLVKVQSTPSIPNLYGKWYTKLTCSNISPLCTWMLRLCKLWYLCSTKYFLTLNLPFCLCLIYVWLAKHTWKARRPLFKMLRWLWLWLREDRPWDSWINNLANTL